VRWLFTSHNLLLSPPPVYRALTSRARVLAPCSADAGWSRDVAGPLSPGSFAHAVCCWLRDAWGLLASNDLLSVSAAPPPNTQSPMRSAALG